MSDRFRASIHSLAAILIAAMGFSSLTPIAVTAQTSLCGNTGTPTASIQHIIIVMLENRSYSEVMNGGKAPYQAQTLATQCGTSTHMYGSTHWSAANYLAVAGGQHPALTASCGTVAACSTNNPNLFAQADAAGLGWRNYAESAPSACAQASTSSYKIGHVPGLFYKLANCKANVIPVADMTASNGAFWNDLQNNSLPGLSWVSPNVQNGGEGPGGLATTDAWLKRLITLIGSSNSYQAGRTAVFVTYDEGTGGDAKVGEDCSNQSLDMAGKQESCHIAFFVVYPWSSGKDTTFFDHYSLTKTTEDLLNLGNYLAHAGDAQTISLSGHLGIQ